MSKTTRHLIAASLLASLSAAAFAQSTTPAPAPTKPPMRSEHMARHDPAKMQAYVAKRQSELKEKLKLTPAQEGAWTGYTTAMQPPVNRPQRPDRAEMEKLTTPQRIDKMMEMKNQRDAMMNQRANATKTFYAALTPEQQKVFDANTMRRHHGERGMHGHHHGAGKS